MNNNPHQHGSLNWKHYNTGYRLAEAVSDDLVVIEGIMGQLRTAAYKLGRQGAPNPFPREPSLSIAWQDGCADLANANRGW